MASQTCPSLQTWQAHVHGTLPAEEQARLIAHLDVCSECQKTVETLAGGGDSLASVARQIGNETLPPEPGLEDVLDRMRSPTVAHPPEGGPSQGELAAKFDLSFLTPSAKPGHLGRLGHYEILEVIGQGGFGTVMRAFDEKLHRVVAIKVLSPLLAANATARKRFIREARAAAGVAHEHVVGIFEVQDEHSPPYLVMQMVGGMSLQEKINKQGPLDLKEILRIGLQVASGLAAAHKQGLVHRDIKPSNILLENGVERVKITDFGLARAVDDASLTQSGVVAGTPQYMSPEQAASEPVDHRADLFSLGSVLYAMCTGRPPFRGDSTMAVLLRVIEDTPRPIRDSNNDIPDWLCDIIEKLHAKKREKRFQTATEVAEVLSEKLAEVQATGRAGNVSPQLAPPPKAAPAVAPSQQRADAPRSPSEARPSVAGARGSPWRSRLCSLASWQIVLCFLGLIACAWPYQMRDPLGGVTWIDRSPEIGVIVAGAPADVAGLKPGDRIVAVAGRQVNARGDVYYQWNQVPLASTFQIVVSRKENENQRKLVTLQTVRTASPVGARLWLKIQLMAALAFLGWCGVILLNAKFPRLAVYREILFLSVCLLGLYLLGWQGGYLLILEKNPSDHDYFNWGGHWQPLVSALAGLGVVLLAVADLWRQWRVWRAEEQSPGQAAADALRAASLSDRSGSKPPATRDRVLAPVEPEWLHAATVREARDGRVLVEFDDGGDQQWIDAAAVRPLQIEQNARVHGWWHGCYYPATVTERSGERVHITYDDGKSEWTNLDCIRVPAEESARPTGTVILAARSAVTSKATVPAPTDELIASAGAKLLAAGIVISCAWIVLLAIEFFTGSDMQRYELGRLLFPLNQFTSFGFGLFILIAGWRLRRQTGHGMATAASILAMLPVNIGVVAGFPLGLSALRDLQRRDVTEALARRRAESAASRAGRSSTHVWQVLFSLLIAYFGLFVLFCAGFYCLCRFAMNIYPAYPALFTAIGAGALASFLWTLALAFRPGGPARRWLRYVAGFHVFLAVGLLTIIGFSNALATGNLVVQCDDPEVRLHVEGEWADKDIAPGRHDFGPGDYVLTAARDGKVFFKKEFHISPSGGSSITVPAATEVGPGPPFFILGRDASPEKKFATLADAVAAAQSGDTIEIRGDGPFACAPIAIRGPSLTIRAAEKFRPAITFNADGVEDLAPLLSTNAPLVLEGLELRRSGGREPTVGNVQLLLVIGTSLRALNCRFFIDHPSGLCISARDANSVACRNCEFLTDKGTAVMFSSTGKAPLILENCILACNRGIELPCGTLDTKGASVRLIHDTFFGQVALQMSLINRLHIARSFEFDARANVLRGVPFKFDLLQEAPLPAAEAEALLLRLALWRDERNVYRVAGSGNFLTLAVKGKDLFPPAEGSNKVADWNRFWGAEKSDSIDADNLRFKGEALWRFHPWPGPGASAEITPADYRLSKGSPGQGVLPGGKDLGADVDLVGPGAAYDRWRGMPEYEEWRKKTDALKNAARNPFAAWGEWLDPTGNCRREVQGAKMLITMPAGQRSLNPACKIAVNPKVYAQNLDAPRFWQDVEGDFTVEVKIADVPKLDAEGNPGLAAAYQGAGLLLWQDDKNFLDFSFAWRGTKLGPSGTVCWCFADGKEAARKHREDVKAFPYLQVERRGDILYLRTSRDGKTWEPFPAGPNDEPVPWKMPRSLKVGVMAFGNMPRMTTFELEGFQIRR